MLTAFAEGLLRNANELSKQGVRTIRTRQELRVKLDSYHEWLARHLHDLHEALVRGYPSGPESNRFEPLAVGVVELKAVAMPLLHNGLSVSGPRPAALYHLAWVYAQAHRPSHLFDVSLFGHEVDDRIGSAGVELS